MKCKTCGLEVAKRQITAKGCEFCRGLKRRQTEEAWIRWDSEEFGERLTMMYDFFQVEETEERFYDGDFEDLYDRFQELMKWNQNGSWNQI